MNPKRIERPGVTISKFKNGDHWTIHIKGVTSGATIHFEDYDEGEISFRFDASRFDPYLIINQ